MTLSKLTFCPLGAIFDVDDTLLDNYAGHLGKNLHEHARLLAVREIGQKYRISGLVEVSDEQNKAAISRASEHSIEGSVWQLMYEVGLVDSPAVDHDNALLKEIAARKRELYEPVLREFGAPLPRALEFVKAMYVLTDSKIAIASGADKHNVQAFLQTSGMSTVFEERRVIARQDFVRAKPDPESFEMAFQTLALADSDRGRVLAFEDDPKGVAAAKRAGLYVCAITSRFSEAELMKAEIVPDMVHGSYADFADSLGIVL
ncbi:hypothetical protein CSA80_04555 [Candidatus Saccharibacteria bacterium]|nr:MAG: hypothetical protein CR973_01370 [Candidatus Saccharibacteria bacterium]PID98939.1 MAG: hypothetical protein CSA80_04555 [Candidatus Saccharibacteria bacterium]